MYWPHVGKHLLCHLRIIGSGKNLGIFRNNWMSSRNNWCKIICFGSNVIEKSSGNATETVQA